MLCLNIKENLSCTARNACRTNLRQLFALSVLFEKTMLVVETNGLRTLYDDLCVETIGTMWNPVTTLVSRILNLALRIWDGNRLVRTAQRACKGRSITWQIRNLTQSVKWTRCSNAFSLQENVDGANYRRTKTSCYTRLLSFYDSGKCVVKDHPS